ncbi:MAG: glycosyltransferase family 4 protein [Armatimonadetes bacterium]|nr:glycosyltransferase family 4 protein [Akkermansiaceae bacterium]
MKIVLITTDSRVHFSDYERAEPYFGTAPEALLQGFALLTDEVEVHVISVTRRPMAVPPQLAANIFFHQPLLPSWGMGRSLFLGSILAVRKLIAEIQPDIVHGQGTERDCALGAVFSGFPNVITIHGNMRVHASRGENKGKPYYKLAALLESLALGRTDGVVSISSYTDRLVSPLVKRSWLLPNATESTYFNASLAPAVPRTLLFVGGLDERKNPVGYIEACGALLDQAGWRFRLCGGSDPDSPYTQRIKELAARNPWIELVGWRSRDELFGEMERASLLVLPTLEDNCPMVVLEAMAVGLPVIASRVGGVPDLIEHGRTGMMFDPLDSESMRQVTAQMIANPEQRTSLATAAREEARKRFHPKVVAQAHLEIYREVLRKNSSDDW